MPRYLCYYRLVYYVYKYRLSLAPFFIVSRSLVGKVSKRRFV